MIGLGFLMAACMAAGQAQAVLGESAASVDSDRKALSAVKRSTEIRNTYTIQEFSSDSVIVREYVSSSGIVFGIAWNGLTHPDLTQLLGSYVSEYRDALQKIPRKSGTRRLKVKTERIVVEKWGHMRNLRGRAYAPALVPSEVSVHEIR
mgnify:CR=1 FL=1